MTDVTPARWIVAARDEVLRQENALAMIIFRIRARPMLSQKFKFNKLFRRRFFLYNFQVNRCINTF